MAENPKVFENLYLAANDPAQPPFLKGDQYLIGGELRTWNGKTCPVYSPVWRQGAAEATTIGANRFSSFPRINCRSRKVETYFSIRSYRFIPDDGC